MDASTCTVAAPDLDDASTNDRNVKSELYRDKEGHEVWRIYEEKPDGSFLVLHEDVASDYDAAWLLDAASHGVSHGID